MKKLHPETIDAARRNNFRLKLYLVLLIASIIYFDKIITGDSVWSVTLGRDYIEHNLSLFKENWSFTAPGNYYPNHEWIWDIICYFLWKVAGGHFFLIAGLHSLLVGTSIVILISPFLPDRKNFNWKSSFNFATVGAIILVCSIAMKWNGIRAESLGFLCLAILVRLLLSKRYEWLPLVTMLWANFHGSFVLGPGLIGLAWLCFVFYGVVLRRPAEKRKVFKWNISNTTILFLAGVLSTLSTLINPLGIKLWAYLLVLRTRSNSGVAEWATLRNADDPKYWWIYAAVVIVILPFMWAFFRSGYKKVENAILFVWLIVFLIAPWTGVRYLLNLIEIAFVPMVIGCLSLSGGKFKSLAQFKLNKLQLTVVTTLLISPIILFSILGTRQINYQEKTLFPGGLISSIKENCNGGRVYNDFGSGGYIPYLDPNPKGRVKIFQDTRYDPYPDSVRQETMEFAYSKKRQEFGLSFEEIDQVLKKYDLNCYVQLGGFKYMDNYREYRRGRVVYNKNGFTLTVYPKQ